MGSNPCLWRVSALFRLNPAIVGASVLYNGISDAWDITLDFGDGSCMVPPYYSVSAYYSVQGVGVCPPSENATILWPGASGALSYCNRSVLLGGQPGNCRSVIFRLRSAITGALISEISTVASRLA